MNKIAEIKKKLEENEAEHERLHGKLLNLEIDKVKSLVNKTFKFIADEYVRVLAVAKEDNEKPIFIIEEIKLRDRLPVIRHSTSEVADFFKKDWYATVPEDEYVEFRDRVLDLIEKPLVVK